MCVILEFSDPFKMFEDDHLHPPKHVSDTPILHVQYHCMVRLFFLGFKPLAAVYGPSNDVSVGQLRMFVPRDLHVNFKQKEHTCSGQIKTGEL